MTRSAALSLLVWVLAFAGGLTPAFADPGYEYSTVKSPPISEANHATILGDIYGGTFTGSGTDLGYGLWNVFSNGSITAYRVYDFDAEDEIIHIVTGNQSNVDRIWTDGDARVTATAKYAGLEQSFGWNGGGSDSTEYFELLNESVLSKTFEVEGDFLWGINPDSYLWWSRDSLNDDTVDHMVTYKIEGLITNETVWALFWEDLPSSHPWDQDYQDFVIEVRAIPEPGSMLLLGLGALALLKKRKT